MHLTSYCGIVITSKVEESLTPYLIKVSLALCCIRPLFTTKMSSYRYKNPHYKPKTVWRPMRILISIRWCILIRLISVELTGPWFNIKMSSYQYRKSHCGDKTILRPSYLHNGISYTGKTTSLHWIRAQITLGLLHSNWGNRNHPERLNISHRSTRNSSCNHNKSMYNITVCTVMEHTEESWNVFGSGNSFVQTSLRPSNPY